MPVKDPSPSVWRSFWSRFRQDRAAVVGFWILCLFLAMAVVGPVLIRTDPAEQQLELRRAPVSTDSPFGRDHFGRDILARIVHGSRYTLLSGALATLIGTIGGLIVGLVSGYYGRWVDEVIMRGVDLTLAFPFFLLAILIIAILGPGLTNAVLAVGLAKIPVFVRFVRGTTLQARESAYTEAARAIGCGDARIMFRHILPNIFIPALVLATVELAATVLSISGLGFLGLGAQPPTPEWGLMLSEARSYLSQAPHIMFFPGMFLSILVLSINLVGDGLQYATDPRRRG